jgi:hypothetical protein
MQTRFSIGRVLQQDESAKALKIYKLIHATPVIRANRSHYRNDPWNRRPGPGKHKEAIKLVPRLYATDEPDRSTKQAEGKEGQKKGQQKNDS